MASNPIEDFLQSRQDLVEKVRAQMGAVVQQRVPQPQALFAGRETFVAQAQARLAALKDTRAKTVERLDAEIHRQEQALASLEKGLLEERDRLKRAGEAAKPDAAKPARGGGAAPAGAAATVTATAEPTKVDTAKAAAAVAATQKAAPPGIAKAAAGSAGAKGTGAKGTGAKGTGAKETAKPPSGKGGGSKKKKT